MSSLLRMLKEQQHSPYIQLQPWLESCPLGTHQIDAISRACLLMLRSWLSGKRIHLPMQETQKTRAPSLGWEDPLE